MAETKVNQTRDEYREVLIQCGIKSGMPRESAEEAANKALEGVPDKVFAQPAPERRPDVQELSDFIAKIGPTTDTFEYARLILEKSYKIASSYPKPRPVIKSLTLDELELNRVYMCLLSHSTVLVTALPGKGSNTKSDAKYGRGIYVAEGGYRACDIVDGQLREVKPEDGV